MSAEVREIRTNAYAYSFAARIEPIAEIDPAEIVDVFTEDAFGSRLTKADTKPSSVIDLDRVNPQTGPIAIRGARAGESLTVEIIDITPTRNFAVSAFIPRVGALTSTASTPTLDEPLLEETFIYPMSGTAVELSPTVGIPLEPFLGTIATAPAREEFSSRWPGPFGGNMDVPDVAAGARVHLPIGVDGAYLFVGDAHAAQGDGEICGVACEITARVRLRTYLGTRSLSVPRIENDAEIMTVGTGRPLEDAVRVACMELINWLEDDFGFDRRHAFQLISQAGRLRVANLVNPLYSVVAKIKRAYVEGRAHGA